VTNTPEARANAAGLAGFNGFNRGNGLMVLTNTLFAQGAGQVHLTTVHELAHNWDDENPRFTAWKALSGWVPGTTPNANQQRSGDGQWLHNTTAQFAEDQVHARRNPREDFCEAFEAYFKMRNGLLAASEQTRLAAKLNFMVAFVAQLGV
jgi:hypothetical protein